MLRRSFIKNSALGSLAVSLNGFPYDIIDSPEIFKLTILHTNDVHSRVEAFPMDGSRNAGLGGAAKRAALIKEIRAKEKNVLLLDAGDIFQGTPYFNFFGGEIEMKLMSEMKYDASTIGNHDFDNGIDGLVKALPFANFPMIISNYDFTNTVMHDKHKPYKVFEKETLRIGVFGLGIKLEGLVPQKLYKDTRYLDPLKMAQQYASLLRHDEKCDYVICLSHLGYEYRDRKISDVIVAMETEDIDLIIGGHTHTFMRKPDIRRNKKGNQVVINQAGWAGIMLGRIDVHFEKNRRKKCITCKNSFIS